MKHLFLIRHAKSSWADESLADRDRPLNNRGEQQLQPLGKALQRLEVFQSSDVFASDATRARQTARGILPADLPADRFHIDPGLYTFDFKRLLEWLKKLDDSIERVVVIGHNPALQELADWLAKHAPMALPTASFLHIRLPGKHWRKLDKNSGTLEHFLIPRNYSYREFERKHRNPIKRPASGAINDLPATLQLQAERLKQLEPGVILGLDDEFLHQYRIALRRSRALAEAIAEVSGTTRLRPAVAQLKRHARATGRLRDLHVFLADLPALCPDTPELRAALETWAGGKAASRQKRLAKRLGSVRYRNSLHSWESEIDSGKFRKLVSRLSAGDIRKAVLKRLRSFNRGTAELLHTAPDEDFHKLRKQLKRIRYLMELDPGARKQDLKTLRKRQDLYGRFQDLHIQLELLEQFRKEAPETLPEAVAGIIDLIGQEKADTRRQILAMGGLGLG